MRLLLCHECQTKQPLGDFEGRPDDDLELIALTAGHDRGRHHGQLVHIEDDDWGLREKREAILAQIDAGLNSGETGLGNKTYAMVDTFKEDAMACFAQHNRNPACSDYKSDSKRLIPDTAAERKELGLVEAKNYDREGGQKTIYLCQYCPVHSMVVQAARKKSGLYNK